MLSFLGTLAASLLPVSRAQGGLARGVTLEKLVGSSDKIVRGVALDTFCAWENISGLRRIVTYSHISIEQPLYGAEPGEEVVVRTLGGHVGDIGQLVHGEAQLEYRQPCLLFLASTADGTARVMSMAQGHYPLRADATGTLRLHASPNLPYLLRTPERQAAAHRLAGLSWPEAAYAIREVVQ